MKKKKTSAREEESRFPATIEQLRSFVDALYAESDRGAVLIGCASLDNDLEFLLREKFRIEAESTNKDVGWLLTGPLAPLRSFGVRIRLARALGLIAEWERKALDVVRDLRNLFAHKEESIDLLEEQTKKIVVVGNTTWTNIIWYNAPVGTLTVKDNVSVDRLIEETVDNVNLTRGINASRARVRFVFVIGCLRLSIHKTIESLRNKTNPIPPIQPSR